MNTPRFWKALAAAAFLCCAPSLPGCEADAPKKPPLTRAWGHCEAREFAKAFQLLREHLVNNPNDPAGHYLLGKCFVNRSPRELTRAKGEFDMARFLHESGFVFEIPGVDMSQPQYLAETHSETAQVLLLTAIEAGKAGISPRASVGILRTALDHAQKGLELHPASGRLAELSTVIQGAIRGASSTDAFPAPPPPGVSQL